MQSIKNITSSIRIGEPVTFRNLTVFPLFGEQAAADYLTLDEALAQKCASVTEVSEGGSVPELKFSNTGTKPVFLLDGEQLIGAKQNRVLNLSILVAGGRVIIIPVTCVEAGRWRHRTSQFESSPHAFYAEGRARKMAQVSSSLRAMGRRRSDQAQVWDDIAKKSLKFRAASPTSAMNAIYLQEEGSLRDYADSFTVQDGQCGAVFAIDGKIIGLELFDAAETLKKLFPKLMYSYGLDALDRWMSKPSEEPPACPVEHVQEFLEKLSVARTEEFPAVGEGTDVRLSGSGITGAALAVGNRIVHLSAFVKVK